MKRWNDVYDECTFGDTKEFPGFRRLALKGTAVCILRQTKEPNRHATEALLALPS
jgi:hypothetical protein